MVFHCQRHCYDTELLVNAVSCSESKVTELVNGKKCNIKCYEVTFEDTVFFPEGGGQPYDTGCVENEEVFRVIRKKGEALHYLRNPVEIGIPLKQTIDWTRRFDHMQQHTGQHLITAIADEKFNYSTSSWNLGEKSSYIELTTSIISNEEKEVLEDLVNEKIRLQLPVITKEYESNDLELKKVRTRGLPDDVVGPVRVVTISGVESNMCCGTHLKNVCELQSIKLLYTEKGKNNNTLLHFVAGNRVLRYLNECISRERSLTAELHSNADDHVRLVRKWKSQLKECQKSLEDAFEDLAYAEALKVTASKRSFYVYHRRDGNSLLLGSIIKKINNDAILKVLTAGDANGPGILIVDGPQELVKDVAPRACEILEGKGGGKTRFMAKVTKLNPNMLNQLQDYVTLYMQEK